MEQTHQNSAGFLPKNLINMNKDIRLKHSSKLYKRFAKMYKRQYDKPRDFILELPPIKLPKKFKGEYVHHIEVSNNIWNGMNLVEQMNRIAPKNNVIGMYRKFSINGEGKFTLSIYGRKLLKQRRDKIKSNEK